MQTLRIALLFRIQPSFVILLCLHLEFSFNPFSAGPAKKRGDVGSMGKMLQLETSASPSFF
jgi:hypothetical protein